MNFVGELIFQISRVHFYAYVVECLVLSVLRFRSLFDENTSSEVMHHEELYSPKGYFRKNLWKYV